MHEPQVGDEGFVDPLEVRWQNGLEAFEKFFYAGRLVPGIKPTDMLASSMLWDKAVSRSSGAFPGVNANLMYFPDDEVTVVVLANNYSPLAGSVAQDVAAMYFGQPYTTPRVTLSKGWPPVAELAGTWQMEGFPPFTITIRSGRPVAAWNGIRASALVPAGPDTWFERLDWATFKFERDASGRLSGGIITAPWAAQPMKLTRLK